MQEFLSPCRLCSNVTGIRSNIIDPQSVREVSLFLAGKINILWVLMYEMQNTEITSYRVDEDGFPEPLRTRGSYSFSPAFEDALLAMVRSVDSLPHPFRGISPNDFRELPDPIEEAITINTEFTDEKLSYLQFYLETRNPRKQLEVLKKILERMYKQLLKNFDIKDILIRVGEMRPEEHNERVRRFR